LKGLIGQAVDIDIVLKIKEGQRRIKKVDENDKKLKIPVYVVTQN